MLHWKLSLRSCSGRIYYSIYIVLIVCMLYILSKDSDTLLRNSPCWHPEDRATRWMVWWSSPDLRAWDLPLQRWCFSHQHRYQKRQNAGCTPPAWTSPWGWSSAHQKSQWMHSFGPVKGRGKLILEFKPYFSLCVRISLLHLMTDETDKKWKHRKWKHLHKMHYLPWLYITQRQTIARKVAVWAVTTVNHCFLTVTLN